MDIVLGTESMWLSARVLGAEAYIPGLANAFPELCARMHREAIDRITRKTSSRALNNSRGFKVDGSQPGFAVDRDQLAVWRWAV